MYYLNIHAQNENFDKVTWMNNVASMNKVRSGG